MLTKNELKSIIRLTQKKYRSEFNRFLAEGGRLCEEAIQSGWEVERLLYCSSFLHSLRARQALKLAQQKNIIIDEVSVDAFVSISDTINSQGVVAVVHKRTPRVDPLEHIRENPRSLYVAVEKLHDPGNLGTIMRTADWLGIDGMLIGRECVEIYNPKVVRASMGSIFRLPIHEVEGFVELLKKFHLFGAVIYSADQSGDFPYTTLRFAPKRVLVLGDEVEGVSPAVQEIVQHRLSIPKRGGGESLNVAIAAAILMAEMVR